MPKKSSVLISLVFAVLVLLGGQARADQCSGQVVYCNGVRFQNSNSCDPNGQGYCTPDDGGSGNGSVIDSWACYRGCAPDSNFSWCVDKCGAGAACYHYCTPDSNFSWCAMRCGKGDACYRACVPDSNESWCQMVCY